MNTTFHVTGMTCEHCINAVKTEVHKIDGVQHVTVDLTSGAVTITSDTPINPTKFAEAIDEAGYEVTP